VEAEAASVGRVETFVVAVGPLVEGDLVAGPVAVALEASDLRSLFFD
jgi:hypothetical protein